MPPGPQDLSALIKRQGNYFAAGVALERDLSTYGLDDEDILVERRGFERRLVCVTILPTVMWVPLNEGTFTPDGSSFAKGSSMVISPRPIISASNAAVIVLVMEPISNAARSSSERPDFALAQK